MKKIVLLAVNSKYVHSALSVWLLKESLRRFSLYEYSCHVVERTIQQSCDEIADNIAAYAPDIVGISAYIWNSAMIPDIIHRLRKKQRDIIIILGGPEALIGEEYWQSQGVDYVLTGEGELSFPSLVDWLSEHSAGQKQNKQTKDLELAEPVNPYTDQYFAVLSNKIAYIETSRGCPYSCAFCLSGEDDVRFFSESTAKEWIFRLSKSNSRTIKFVDRTFNCSKERAYGLFEHIINLDTDRCFHFEVAADLFDEKTLNLLKRAAPGRIQFESGVQSFFEPALEAVSRKTDLEKVEENIKKLVAGKNIHIHIDLIAGLPYETYTDFQNSFNRAFALGAHTLQLGFLKSLHGSELRRLDESKDMLFSKEPPYEILHSIWLNEQDISALCCVENALRHTYNKCRFLNTIKYVLSVSEMTAFSLFYLIGTNVPNHGTQLEIYAAQIYDVFSSLQEVNRDILCDNMICDWLGMVKGKNMPEFMKKQGLAHSRAAEIAKKTFNLEIKRSEFALLSTGKAVFVDSAARDIITSLYKLHYLDFSSLV